MHDETILTMGNYGFSRFDKMQAFEKQSDGQTRWVDWQTQWRTISINIARAYLSEREHAIKTTLEMWSEWVAGGSAEAEIESMVENW